MIVLEDFERIKEEIKRYHYTSLEYTPYESVKEYCILTEEKNGLFLFGYNEESEKQEIHWACNEVLDVLSVVKRVKVPVLVTFIPLKWRETLVNEGFIEYGFLREYWIPEISKVNIERINMNYLKKGHEKEASEVTYSCQWQSREFRGESEEWIRTWLDGTCSDAVHCSNTNILVQIVEGVIAGIVCVGIYGENSKNGKVIWVRELAVKKEFQGKGIGSKLMIQAIAYGKEQGAVRSFLMADDLNEPAKHLYKKIGYIGSETEIQLDMIHEIG